MMSHFKNYPNALAVANEQSTEIFQSCLISIGFGGNEYSLKLKDKREQT